MHSNFLVPVESGGPTSGKLVGLLVFLALITSCAKSSISDRDAKREQLRSAAETKRKELQVIIGSFSGSLLNASGPERRATLQLEILNVSTPVEGQIDPVDVPTLIGSLRFPLGGPNEFVSFGVEKADFDARRNQLSLVVNNDQEGSITIGATFDGKSKLTGKWNSKVAFGDISLDRSQTQSTGPEEEPLKGEYGGIILDEQRGLYQYAHMTLTTSNTSPTNMKVTASLRIIYGDLNSSEFLTYTFDPANFIPATGQLTLQSEANDVSIQGVLSKGELKGEWKSKYTGRIGAIHFLKNVEPTPQAGILAEPLRGTYSGTHKNTNPQANLPETLMVSFVTSNDPSKPNGIGISGSLRWVVGGPSEFFDCRFSSVDYNFFTKVLTAKTAVEGQCANAFTLRGTVDQNKIKGTVSVDSMGEVGNFEVKK